MGIGVGWNPVEFQALGQDFQNRGQRVEEQIAVLRALWTQEVVNFDGPVAPNNLRWLESPSGAASYPHMDGIGSACEAHSSRSALTQGRTPGRRLKSSIRSRHRWARGHPTYARLCQGSRTRPGIDRHRRYSMSGWVRAGGLDHRGEDMGGIGSLKSYTGNRERRLGVT